MATSRTMLVSHSLVCALSDSTAPQLDNRGFIVYLTQFPLIYNIEGFSAGVSSEHLDTVGA